MACYPKPDNPLRWFGSSPEVIQKVMMLQVRFPRSLRNVQDLDIRGHYNHFKPVRLAAWPCARSSDAPARGRGAVPVKVRPGA